MSEIVVTSAYPELTALVMELAAELKMEVCMIETVLEDAIEEVKKLLVKEQPLVLVSRGATAEMLRKTISLPVVLLSPSEMDVLQAIAKAKERSQRIGYLSYPQVTDAEFISKVFDVLHVKINHYPYKNIVELSSQIEKAHYDGCEAIIGGGLRGVRIAKAYGMEGFLIYSSRTTVTGALERARELVAIQTQKKEDMDRQRRSSLAKGLVARFSFRDLVGPALRETVAKAERFSEVDATVLILGESGTGKELFAQSIHASSPRNHGPFVALNCAALPEHLLESELFGYEEGSFTGAKKGGRIGLFELADHGTIFLDEIGKMSSNLQAGLLRVLQTKEIRRLGGDRITPVNVRVIAASNEDLISEVDHGHFRRDLYYRLNVLNLYLPPLRHRRQDIPVLIQHILRRREYSLHDQVAIAPEFMALLQSYEWPGNVRELENILERYVVLVGGKKSLNYKEFLASFPELLSGQGLAVPKEKDLVPEGETEDQTATVGGLNDEGDKAVMVRPGTLEEMELQLMFALLQRCHGNKSQLAELLGISRTTLWKKLNP
ncbi:propionate catabolism operon regulatory protein [Peptococcaceae bacterium CEB3]|nr:propionate catabolism operon regulatory protein [Peptococcaceae bacterium CEB3]